MKSVLSAVLFGMIGFMLAYLAGAEYFCSGDNPGNLCGLPAAFVTGPLGGAAGVAWSLRRRKRR